MRNIILAASIICFAAVTYAGDPQGGCRVKTDSLEQNAHILNNAGCLISRTNEKTTELLMLYVDKGPDEKGWVFPGGKPTSKKNDGKMKNGVPKSKAMKKIADSIEYDYVEPAVCTASRETKEEVGFDVVVGDLIHLGKYFAAFECLPTLPEHLEGISTRDAEEVKNIKWVSMKDVEDGLHLLYQNKEIFETYFNR